MISSEAVLNIVLYQPRIPANTGNIIRLCANSGMVLHIIHPLGFVWDDKQLRRAGLDYHEFAHVTQHVSWQDFMVMTASCRRFIITTKAKNSVYHQRFSMGDYLIFGSEDAGIASEDQQMVSADYWLRIPMQAESRSLNLANAVALVGFEGLRQLGLPNLV